MTKLKMIKACSVLQHDASDCGVACLASVIRYLGGDSNLETLRSMSGTGKSGVSLLGIYHAANKSGLIAKGYEASKDDLKFHPHVLILHVIIEEKLAHFIVCFGYENETFIIWDPATGVKFMDEDDLTKIWSGKCLSLYPGESFIRRDRLVSSKRKWLMSMLKPDRDMLAVSVMIGILVSMLGIVMALYTQKLIDKILPSGEMKLLFVSSALVLLLLLTRIAIASLRQMLLLTQGKMFNIRVVDDFFSSIMHLRKSFFDARKTGDFVARLNDTVRIQRVISEIASSYIIDILVIGITISVLFYYSFSAGLISIISLPILYLTVSIWHEKIRSSQHSLMAGYASSESNFIDSINGITEIKSLNWQDSFSKKNQAIYSDFQNRIFSLGKIKVKINLITGLSSSLYLVVLLVWSSRLVMMSAMTEGELMAIISLGSSLVPSALNIALIAIPLSEVKVAINRMFEFTRMDSEKDKNNMNGKELKIDCLEIRNISFRFPGLKLLLDNINIKLKKGEIISIVGESGCGKSTLASLVLRFYSPESGTICINNTIDSSEIEINTWRSRIVIIPQEIHIFNGTILENLITEMNESRINELLATITELGLIPFINSFPSGLMTLVGEEGINISGGQKQVIAFLRAFLAKPDIMIIDEGTSNMDKVTETLIINLLIKMRNQLCVLMISHKLNMIKKLSDRIYVIEDRKIIIQGTHEEVVMAENFYSRTWEDFK